MSKIAVKVVRALLGIAFLAVLAAPNTNADPLTFSNVVAVQNGGSTQIDLFSNPGVTLIGPNISFLVTISGTLPASGIDTLQITFTEAGMPAVVQTFSVPIFSGLTLPYSQIFSVSFLNATTLGTAATLRLDILGSSPDFVIPSGPQANQVIDSYTYSFNGAQPVPEPASILILFTGLTGLAATGKRRLTRNGKNRHRSATH
jgi:hypothetical protein